MKPELEEILQHHGVKGMKWGKHLKTHVDSIKREHSWKTVSKNASNMSTKDLQKYAARAQLENDMKRIAKKRKVGSKKDKQDYLNRANMSDQELFRKVQRLRVKENLNRTANDATKSQKELAKKVISVAAPLVLSYALTGTVGKKDLLSAALNAGGEKTKLLRTLINQANQAKKVKHSGIGGETSMDEITFGQEIDDMLQHHGVKGMHWGARKKIQQIVKNHNAKRNAKILAYHDKHKDKKTYSQLYAKNSQRYKTHLAAATRTQMQIAHMQRQKAITATHAALLAAPFLAAGASKAGSAFAKAATNPDNIRRGKNIIQAIKRSPIRYVDGKMMKNVVHTVL